MRLEDVRPPRDTWFGFFFGLHKDRDDGAFLILRLCDGVVRWYFDVIDNHDC